MGNDPPGRARVIEHALFPIMLAIALILLNAFFVAAEFGMVKLRHTRVEAIQSQYGFRGRILSTLHQNLDAYLSACQLGITLASLGLGWIGEPAVAKILIPVFALIGLFSTKMVSFLAFFLAFSLLSFLHIVVGELMPKSLAIRQSERISLWTAVPLYGFYWLMFPAIWLLNTCSLFLLKCLNLDKVHGSDQIYTYEEMRLIFAASNKQGDLTKEEVDILEHVLEFSDLKVADIMRPAEEMIMLHIDKPIGELLATISETRYSRYPVFDEKLQEVIGILHVKDLIVLLYQKTDIKDLRPFIRPEFSVQQNLSALKLLKKFRSGKPHLSIVYGTTQTPIGFVTLDNILHVLVGRITDEFHRTKDDWSYLPDGSLLIKGNCSLYALERALDIDLNPNDKKNVSTVNGLILQKIHAFPKAGDKINFDQFYVVIEQLKGPRIVKMRIFRNESL